jgi:transposase InsO family protein
MEAEWMAKRATLRWRLAHLSPVDTERVCRFSALLRWLGEEVEKRLKEASPDDLSVLHARSRARRTPFPAPDPAVVARIVQIRQAPPEGLQRVPGSRTILFYLHRDPDLQVQGLRVPRSARTIWKILRQEGLILDPPAARHRPLPPREPLEEVQIDFKDVTTVPADPDGKRQHVVETCNFVDAGTSILLEAQVRDDFHAQTAFDTVVAFLRRYGLPRMFTFDRDPRWVGSQSGRDFPSALRRFLLCLGIDPNVCPPHQPQKQAYVERYHRSYKYEWRLLHRPATVQAAIEVTRAYQEHYNWQRPHQGRSCHNVPPRTAHPNLPHLPALEASVDPDSWVDQLHGRAYVRPIGADGCVTVDERSYYVGLEHKGKTVALLVNAPGRCFDVWEGRSLLKRLPIKGLQGAPLPLERFIAWMREQALAEERRGTRQTRAFGWRQISLWDDASA